MKKLILFFVVFLVFVSVYSKPRPQEQALQLATAFAHSLLQQKNIKGISRKPQTLRFSYKCSDVIDQNIEKDYFYVFNKGENDGFIIVSADDRANSILGYTDNGSFEYEKMPDNMKYWLDCYKMEIKSLDENIDLSFTKPISKVKSEMLNEPKYVTIPSLDTLKTAVIPLLKTKWDQGYPYNVKCPVINGGTSVTGCVATAMAQIMKFHQWPLKGIGSYSYSWQEQTLSADFSSTTYDWLNMLNAGASNQVEVDAVSTLMYHCGVSVNMQYSPGGSSAYSESVSTALINYFNYDINLKFLSRFNFKTSDWIKIIKDELSHNRPLYYSGNRGGTFNGGHAFVCDGYDENDLFHINWGWSGSGNGYFNVSALGGNLNVGYNYWQNIIIGIQRPTGNDKVITSNIVKSGSITILPNDTIGRNELFDISVLKLINKDFDNKVFNGQIALGIYNVEEQITILKNQPLTGLAMDYGTNQYYYIYNIKVPDTVPNGTYKLSYFAKQANQTYWQLVNTFDRGREPNWIEVKVSNSSIVFRMPEPESVKLNIQSILIPENLDKDKSANIKFSVQNTGMEYDSRLRVNLESVKDSMINQIYAVIPAHILSGETNEFTSNNKITLYPGKYKLKIYYDPLNMYYQDGTYSRIGSGLIVDVSKPKMKEGVTYCSSTKTVIGKLLNPPAISSNVSIQIMKGDNDISNTFNSSDSTFVINPYGVDSIPIYIRYYKSDEKTVYNDNTYFINKTDNVQNLIGEINSNNSDKLTIRKSTFVMNSNSDNIFCKWFKNGVNVQSSFSPIYTDNTLTCKDKIFCIMFPTTGCWNNDSIISNIIEIPKKEIFDNFSSITIANSNNISYENTFDGEAVFKVNDNIDVFKNSFITYSNNMIPAQGTIEFRIKVLNGKYYFGQYGTSNSVATVFAIQNSTINTYWDGSGCQIVVYPTGKIVFRQFLETGGYKDLIAENTAFRFNEWHSIGISYGNQGMKICVNGIVKAFNENFIYMNEGLGILGGVIDPFFANGKYWWMFEGLVDKIKFSNLQSDFKEDIPSQIIQIKSDSELSIYPNPVRNVFQVNGLVGENLINIYSLQGSLLKTIPTYRSTDQIDISTLKSGVYLVKISGSDGKVYAGKFVKE